MYVAEDIINLLDKLKICRDSRGIIKDFLYNKCIHCKTYKRIEHLELKYDNTYICRLCKVIEGYVKCNNCKLNYKLLETTYCSSCSNFCFYYCKNCYRNEDTIRFLDD